ncbi:MAG: AzlD domain-containing protein [Anaerolineales bacterium]
MSNAEIWLIIVGGMVVTYLTRLSFTVLVPPDRLSPTFSRGLVYIPPAVLAAIVLPELLLVEGNITISPTNFRLMAGVLATLVAWRFKNTWLTIASGLLALWLLANL